MENINNLNTYCTEMSKSIEDKLWFVQFLKTFNKIDNPIHVYDYGCANGELLQHLAPIFPDIEFIGIDINEDMLEIAYNDNIYPNITYMPPKNIWCDSTVTNIVIISSLFHELISYNTFKETYNIIMKNINPDYIFFRDMMVNESTKRYALFDDILKLYPSNHTKVLYNVNINNLFSYDNRNVLQQELIHFLLKYRFKENWNREVQENYLPVYLEDLHNYFPDFNIIYQKHYILPFIKEQVKKDFNIDLMDKTHVNIIFKNKN